MVVQNILFVGSSEYADSFTSSECNFNQALTEDDSDTDTVTSSAPERQQNGSNNLIDVIPVHDEDSVSEKSVPSRYSIIKK